MDDQPRFSIQPKTFMIFEVFFQHVWNFGSDLNRSSVLLNLLLWKIQEVFDVLKEELLHDNRKYIIICNFFAIHLKRDDRMIPAIKFTAEVF